MTAKPSSREPNRVVQTVGPCRLSKFCPLWLGTTSVPNASAGRILGSRGITVLVSLPNPPFEKGAMAVPRPWSPVHDGIVSGRLLRKSHACDVCGLDTACILVWCYKMPEGVRWTSLIISTKGDPPWKVAVHLGVGCGCYAKLHRQIAHIGHHKS